MFLFFSHFANAADNYRFHTMSPEGGFYFDGIIAIQQDNEGFIWVLLENSLYRFDGYEYKSYSKTITNLKPSKEWQFKNIQTNSKGTIIIGTNNGLYIYDKPSDAFNLVCDTPFDNFAVYSDSLIFLRNGGTWKIFNPQNKKLFTPIYGGKDAPIAVSTVNCLKENDFYVFSNYRNIYRYNRSKKEFALCLSLPENYGRIRKAGIGQGKLYLLAQNCGLVKINLSNFEVEDVYKISENIDDRHVRTMFIDKNGKIWLGTIAGIYVFNPDDREFAKYEHSDSQPFSLPNNSVWTINEDRQKNIWIGLYSGNICYVNLDESQPFTTFTPSARGLSQGPVSAFAEDRRYIWIGTEGGGLNRMDKETGKFDYFTHSEQHNSISFNNIKSIVSGAGNNLWIATYSGGLNCFNSKTGKFSHFSAKNNENSLLNNSIRKIIPEKDAGLWIAYQMPKLTLSYYSFETKQFTHYDFPDEHYILDMVRTGEKYIYILCADKIHTFDIQKHTIEKTIGGKERILNFSSFCSDFSGNLWIGTNGNGLVKYSPDDDKLSLYDGLFKLGATAINSLCLDDEGNIWLGSDNGLLRYKIAENVFSRFTKSDGIQGNVYYPLATLKSADGNLYFGGTNGFTIVNPAKIRLNQYKPKIIISDFLIDNRSSANLLPSEQGKEIVLSHSQANFSFVFSSDNYLIPDKTRFKYRLRGYDDKWTETDAASRIASYAKVPPGTYRFEVAASNNDGLESGLITTLKIRCKPAFWAGVPAYLLYLLTVIFVAFVIFRYFDEKKKLKMQRYLENVEKNKKEEIHNAQLQFYTDISHDFKTPLSLILTSLYNMKKEGLNSEYYNIIDSNSKRLLKLVNELMDFKTLENGKMKLKLQTLEINDFIGKIASDFNDFAQSKNIDFAVNVSENPLYVCIDVIVAEKIIINLLNNALKYTLENGSVSVEIIPDDTPVQSDFSGFYEIKSEEFIQENTFAIAVRDTGKGIRKDLIESVFEQYFKVDSDETEINNGTGIGLALVKRLILLHKGKLTVYSEPDRGSYFEIRFNKDETVYEPTDFVQDEYPNFAAEKILKNEHKRILLVEDHHDLRKLIAEALSEEYEIVQAENGEIAGKILEKRIIDLIISDILMPVKNGIEFCKETKSNIETSHIPFILLTAKSDRDSKLEGADSGADIYLEKPVDIELLKLNIQNIFKRQLQLREFYSKNFFTDSPELSANEQDNRFMKTFAKIIEENLNKPYLDVGFVASQLSMSRSKLYNKIKQMTGKSVIEFILNRRLQRAARLIIEDNMSLRQIMDEIGIESQPYFTNVFKREFGDTPSVFAAKHKTKKE
ncbi:MAG: response regulator [Dysgonamonadaceae bacterium]|jgi:signal transduction histidine kinase/ligand-binding sensor domain-containing protein/DNA-binding response OmpR family regulator|nr:response regulator [Dysgonamonadaceae bacterium]